MSSMMALHSRYDKVPFSPEECRMDKRGIRDFADDGKTVRNKSAAWNRSYGIRPVIQLPTVSLP